MNYLKHFGKLFALLASALIFLYIDLQLHIYEPKNANKFLDFFKDAEVFKHLSIAIFIALVLEIINESAVREKIAKGAKDILSQVVYVLTKSKKVGESLDKLITNCSQIYRDNYEINFRISKKGSKTYLIEKDIRCSIKNQTSNEINHQIVVGGDEKKLTINELQIGKNKFKIFKPNKIEKHGKIGIEYRKKIKIKAGDSIDVRLLYSHEIAIKDCLLFEMIFGYATNVKFLKITIGDKCDIDATQIRVLPRGIPIASKKFELEYEFSNCFLPHESISVVKNVN